MGTQEFKQLDHLIISDLTDPVDKPLYYYLSVDSLQALDRYSNLHRVINTLSLIQEELTVEVFNRTIESYMALLLTTSCIVTIDHTQCSPHYNLVKSLSTKSPSIPQEYLENLLFTSSKTWGTDFGTLGYFLYEASDYKHYTTPSESIYRCTTQFALRETSTLLNKIIPLFESDNPLDDVALYLLQIDYINQSSDIQLSFELLSFLKIWLKKALLLSISEINSGFELKPENTNSYKAYKLIREIQLLCTQNFLDEKSIGNLDYELIFNSLSPIYYKLVPKIIGIAATTEYNPNDYLPNKYEDLAKELIENVASLKDPNVLKKATYIITDDFYPGGYNLLLVATAANLLNKAFYLSHITTIGQDLYTKPLNYSSSFSSLQNSSLVSSIGLLNVIARTFKLLYLAGYSLLKSNLVELRTIGSNLITLSYSSQSLPDQLFDLTK